jgi:hypothetical protein
MQIRFHLAPVLFVVGLAAACGGGGGASPGPADGGALGGAPPDGGAGGSVAAGDTDGGGGTGGAALDGGAEASATDAGASFARCIPGPAKPCRALWVWTTPDNQTLVDFATAQGVEEIFYSVSSTITGTELARLQGFRTLTRAAGIVLDALGGDPTWATTDVAGAIAWENDAVATGLFDGIHLDVEPMALSDWSTNTAADALSFVAALKQIRANDAQVHLELDCQFSYGAVAVAGYASLADAIDTTVDEITIMSYRNTDTGANGMFGIAQDELTRGQHAGIPVRLGAETNDVTPAEVTFYGMTRTAMAAVLAQTDTSAAGYSAYRGIAIEDYTGWSALAP